MIVLLYGGELMIAELMDITADHNSAIFPCEEGYIVINASRYRNAPAFLDCLAGEKFVKRKTHSKPKNVSRRIKSCSTKF